MIYTDLTRKAMVICYNAHNGSVDRSGVPYVFHPIHIAEKMDDEYSTCVALLHDVVEDTDYEISDIEKEGFPREIIDAVICITKDKDEDYYDYIRRVKTNPLASKVKLADLEHNSDLTRLTEISDYVLKRQEKYKHSKGILLSD